MELVAGEEALDVGRRGRDRGDPVETLDGQAGAGVEARGVPREGGAQGFGQQREAVEARHQRHEHGRLRRRGPQGEHDSTHIVREGVSGAQPQRIVRADGQQGQVEGHGGGVRQEALAHVPGRGAVLTDRPPGAAAAPALGHLVGDPARQGLALGLGAHAGGGRVAEHEDAQRVGAGPGTGPREGGVGQPGRVAAQPACLRHQQRRVGHRSQAGERKSGHAPRLPRAGLRSRGRRAHARLGRRSRTGTGNALWGRAAGGPQQTSSGTAVCVPG